MRPPDRKVPRFPIDPIGVICIAIVVAIVLALVLVMGFDVLPSQN